MSRAISMVSRRRPGTATREMAGRDIIAPSVWSGSATNAAVDRIDPYHGLCQIHDVGRVASAVAENPGEVATRRSVAQPTRLIVADPGLISLTGHHFGYSQSVASAAMRRGMDAVVLANYNFDVSQASGGVPCKPSFHARYQSSSQSSRFRRAAYGSASYLPAGIAPFIANSLRAARRITQRRLAATDTFGEEL